MSWCEACLQEYGREVGRMLTDPENRINDALPIGHGQAVASPEDFGVWYDDGPRSDCE